MINISNYDIIIKLIGNGEDLLNNNKNITVKQAIDRYIESKTAVLSPSTIYGYKKANQRYLYILHDVKIAKLDQELIQRAINKLSYCYSPKTVRNAYGLLHASLQMFAPDFVYRISLPQKIKSSFYVPDENEIKVIYKLIKNTELEIPFLLASQCGLRPSEICALTKDCITADGLEIRKAVVINEHGREVYKPPKSYAGYRTKIIDFTAPHKRKTESEIRISEVEKMALDKKMSYGQYVAMLEEEKKKGYDTRK